MEVQYKIKFMRCPGCQAFSLRCPDAQETDGWRGDDLSNGCICNNCGKQYVFHGDTLKEKKTGNWLPQQEPEPEPVAVPEIEAPIIKSPYRERRSIPKAAFFLIPLLAVIIIGAIAFLVPGNGNQAQYNPLPPRAEQVSTPGMTEDKGPNNIAKTGVPSESESSPEIEKTNEEIPTEEPVNPGDTTSEPTAASNPAMEETPQETTDETPEAAIPGAADDSPPVTATQVTNEGAKPPDSKTIIKTSLPATKNTAREEDPANDGHTKQKSFKVFDYSILKIRKSSPDISDPSNRWYFQRKTITVKRSETQRVYIAGDPTGKRKWAVDDEVSINGEKIRGISEEMNTVGYIPESNQVQPYDITHLVPSNRKAVLDIKLVDYGIFWGNTSIYIVVM